MYVIQDKHDLHLFCEWWSWSMPLAKNDDCILYILQKKILLESTQNPYAKSTNTFVSHLMCVMKLYIPLSINQYSIFNK